MEGKAVYSKGISAFGVVLVKEIRTRMKGTVSQKREERIYAKLKILG